MDASRIELASFAGAGALLAALSGPLIRRKVKPNLWYGVRTPKTMRDEETWYSSNEYGGRMLLRAGLFQVASCAALYGIPGVRDKPETYAALGTAALIGSTLFASVLTLRHVQKL